MLSIGFLLSVIKTGVLLVRAIFPLLFCIIYSPIYIVFIRIPSLIVFTGLGFWTLIIGYFAGASITPEGLMPGVLFLAPISILVAAVFGFAGIELDDDCPKIRASCYKPIAASLEKIKYRGGDVKEVWGVFSEKRMINRRKILIDKSKAELVDDAGRKKLYLYIASIRKALLNVELDADNSHPIEMINGYLDDVRADSGITTAHKYLPDVREDIQLLAEEFKNKGLNNSIVLKRLLLTFRM